MTIATSYSLENINAMSTDDFVEAFGAIYEHSPWVAERAAAERPFASIDEMRRVMQSAVATTAPDVQLALICSHPQLQGRAAETLTADSMSEQRSAGLDQCSPEEVEELAALNGAYRDKFGFPFVIAVRGLTRHDIIEELARRLGNDRDVEFHACLLQIYKIAELRIAILTH